MKTTDRANLTATANLYIGGPDFSTLALLVSFFLSKASPEPDASSPCSVNYRTHLNHLTNTPPT